MGRGIAVKASLDLYRVFVSVARLHSITLAAEELYISQPAVSHSVARLEEALGCRLFARTPRGVRLTSEGETLYPYAAAALEQLALGEKKLTEQLGLESGEICVGASDMTLQFFLLPYLERFHTLYPKIKISVTNGPTPETLRFLEEGTIDFGVVSQPVTDGGDCLLTRSGGKTAAAGGAGTPAGDLPTEKHQHPPVYRRFFCRLRRPAHPGIRACHQRSDRAVCRAQPWHRLRGGGVRTPGYRRRHGIPHPHRTGHPTPAALRRPQPPSGLQSGGRTA